MNIEKWLKDNTASLSGKVVAITGSTGGLGSTLCRYFAQLGADILTLDRNPQKSLALKDKILGEFSSVNFQSLQLDLNKIQNVSDICDKLNGKQIDYLILNAGIYNVPLCAGDTDYNNIFQVNFVSQYCLVKGLLPTLRQNRAKVVIVGSIAHNYSKTNPADVDFSNATRASKIYGNSKRFLMFSLYELLKDDPDVSIAVAHPGVTLTNMTNHYPKAINWLVKLGIKLLFPSPQQAALSILYALFADCSYCEWIGPARCNVWGRPKISKLTTCKIDESTRIFDIAENIYSTLTADKCGLKN